MIDIKDIEPGNSYACKFRLKNIPLDKYGRPGGLASLADLPIERYGDYESIGVLKTRDSQKELVEVIDEKGGKTHVVPFADIWDIDVAEFSE